MRHQLLELEIVSGQRQLAIDCAQGQVVGLSASHHTKTVAINIPLTLQTRHGLKLTLQQ